MQAFQKIKKGPKEMLRAVSSRAHERIDQSHREEPSTSTEQLNQFNDQPTRNYQVEENLNQKKTEANHDSETGL